MLCELCQGNDSSKTPLLLLLLSHYQKTACCSAPTLPHTLKRLQQQIAQPMLPGKLIAETALRPVQLPPLRNQQAMQRRKHSSAALQLSVYVDLGHARVLPWP